MCQLQDWASCETLDTAGGHSLKHLWLASKSISLLFSPIVHISNEKQMKDFSVVNKGRRIYLHMLRRGEKKDVF